MHDEKTVYAFDLETTRLASDAEREFAAELGGASPWSRPDLFGFGAGVILNVETGIPCRIKPGEGSAEMMVKILRQADTVVSYNGESFDLGVLSAYGDVSSIRQKHVDLNVLVREGLNDLPEALAPGVDKLRQGGLDGLARANGLSGKTGGATAAPALLREGRVEEVLNYCEHDARLVAELYRLARDRGELLVEAYYYDEQDGERVYLPAPVYVSLTL